MNQPPAPRSRGVRAHSTSPASIIFSLLLTTLTAACAQAPVEQPASTVPPVMESPPIPAPAEAPAVTEDSTTVTTSTIAQPMPIPPVCVAAPAPPPKPKPKPHKKPAEEKLASSLPDSAAKTADLPKPAGAAIANVKSLAPNSVLAVLGKKVWGPNDDDFGRVVDVLVDPDTGAIRSAVIDFGGFLGVGNRKIAVDWSLLQFKPGSKQVLLNLRRAQVVAAPEYRENSEHPSEVIAPADH